MDGAPGRLRRLRVLSAVGCAVGACGGGDASREERIDGQHAYTVRCAYCHDVPNGVGGDLTAKVLAAYNTLGGLDRYLRAAMPHEAPGSLEDAEYDAIMSYLLESRELVPDGPDHRTLPDSTALRGPG